ncbi:MAG: phosphodiester glycosidase family protein [Lachnospiraceae bacterium]|nr:phosphodiester glycosidase family protein [Lachnospiraceae bacterium]
MSVPQGTVVAHAKEHSKEGDAPAKKPSGRKKASDKAVSGESKVSERAKEQESVTEKSTKTPKSSGTTSEITLTEYREYDTDIYVAQIDTSTPVALRTAFAQGAYGRNVTEKTTEIAESVGAVLAINGDYYGARETGYVIRNGVLYREEGKDGQKDLVIWQDGSFRIVDEGEITAHELVEQGAWQVLSFGPALIEAGEISVSTTDEVDKAMRDNPRTAIGILANGDYVMVVSDGRTNESVGLSLYELAEFMQKLGVVTAYNLDGGGSSTMVYNGELVNNPTTTGRIRERAVSDIVYIAY